MAQRNDRTPVPSISRRSFLRGLGLGALSLGGAGLAACAAPAASPTASSSGAAQPGSPPAPAAAGPFTFNAWSLNEGASKTKIEEIVAAYQQQSGATITTAAYPYNEYLNQLLLQASGGTLSGAAQLDIAWLTALASTGKLRDLGPLAAGAGYTQAALSSGQHNGVQYGLPWTTGSIGMVANTELLERAGVAGVPTTVEEFEAALEKLKALGDGVVPYAAMTDVAQLKDIIPWIWTFGGTVVDGGAVTLGDAGSVQAVEWYKRLLDRGLIAPDVDRFDARQLFSQGKVGFYDDAIVGKASVIKDSPVADLAGKMQPLARPRAAGADAPQALLWGHLVVVLEGAGADAAAAFAKFLTSDQATTVGYFEALSLPPTTDAGLAAAPVQADAYTATWSGEITRYARPNPFWPYAESAEMERLLGEQVQAVLIGSASGQEAMQKAGEAIGKLIG
jgi:multiple sugar transport system substrate-binding protein